MENEEETRQAGLSLLRVMYIRGHIPEEIYSDPNACMKWWEALDETKRNIILEDCSTSLQAEYDWQKREKWKILLIPAGGIGFALMAAVPGALIGLITGLFGFHLIAGIIGGIFFLMTYPRSRRRWGSQVDALTYFFALCGAVGGGLTCYFVGSLLQ